MAITPRAEGTWFTIAASSTAGVTIPGSPAAGDMMFVFASWKDFSLTATCNQSFTEITEFADGSVAAGNGAGSMKVAAWYKEHTGSEVAPEITFSGNVNVASVVMVIFQKGASETWDTPAFVTAAWPLAGVPAETVSASSTVAVPDGSLVQALIGIRDDSTTFTRATTTGIDVASGITWAADYVEYPAAHLTTTSGGDMAADLGYRLVTTGGTVTLRVTATLSADETGSVLWVVQSVTATAAERVPFYRPYTQLLSH